MKLHASASERTPRCTKLQVEQLCGFVLHAFSFIALTSSLREVKFTFFFKIFYFILFFTCFLEVQCLSFIQLYVNHLLSID